MARPKARRVRREAAGETGESLPALIAYYTDPDETPPTWWYQEPHSRYGTREEQAAAFRRASAARRALDHRGATAPGPRVGERPG